MKLFNGSWGIEPWIQEGKQVGSKVVVTQEVLPSILPPGPLGNSYLRFVLWMYLTVRNCYSHIPMQHSHVLLCESSHRLMKRRLFSFLNPLTGSICLVSVSLKYLAVLVGDNTYLSQYNCHALTWSRVTPGGYVSRIMGNQVKAALHDLSVEAERLQRSKSSSAD